MKNIWPNSWTPIYLCVSIKGVFLHASCYYATQHQEIKISYGINFNHKSILAYRPFGNFLR